MTVKLSGSGVATSCAMGLLMEYAQTLPEVRREYVLVVREELCAEYKELVAQRDRARESAISYATSGDITAPYMGWSEGQPAA